ncbi:MAG: amidase [Anaerolineales bacterium]|nr:amidase [Anaerolineales bacterium]
MDRTRKAAVEESIPDGGSDAGAILEMSALQLARAIREGRLDPIRVLEVHIARIRAVNPSLNALVAERFERARDDAEQAARAVAKGDGLAPLHGVPVTVKDALPVAGLPFTGGLSTRSNVIADEDAEAVSRLRSAGAIVLGKTNTPELCASVETHNHLYGRTRNPWDLDRTPGGSSGGEAALIAAGGSPLGLGSDLAGSLRIPAAFCGIAALKPTANRIPTEGHFPADPPGLEGWNTVGPLARHVEDLALAYSVLTGTELDLTGGFEVATRVVIPRYPSGWSVSDPVREAVERAAQTLADEGLEFQDEANLALDDVAYEFAVRLHRAWLPVLTDHLGAGGSLGLALRFPAAVLGLGSTSVNTLASLLMVALMGGQLRRRGYGQGGLQALRASVLEHIGPGGLIVWPAVGSVAPRHGLPYGLTSGTVFSGVFNALGMPAAVVPVGRSKQGLPIGVQVAGSPGAEELVLAAAAQLEAAHGGFRPPPLEL